MSQIQMNICGNISKMFSHLIETENKDISTYTWRTSLESSPLVIK